MIKPGNYYFSPSAISLTLNAASGAFTSSETVMASAVAGAAMKVASRLVTSRERVLILGYGAQLQHRQFNMALHNTVLGYPGNKFANDDICVYMRLDASNNGSMGEMVFLPYELDYDGTILTDEPPKVYESIEYGSRTEGENVIYFLLNENTENVSGLTYYYIHIATIAAPQGGKRTWKEVLQCGQLDTAKGNDEKSDSTLEKMFKLVNNVIHVLLPFDKLTFQKSGTEAYIDHIVTLTVSSAETAMEWISDTAVATTASIASFVSEKIGELDSRFFRKDTDDASPFSATFGALSTAKMKQPDGSVSDGSFSSDGKTDLATSGADTSIGGDLDVKGDADVEGALHVKKDLSIDKNIFVGGNVGSELKPILLAFINFLKSDNYRNENLFGEGFMLTNENGNGQSSLVVDNLFVRMKAIFNELEIRKLSYAGGNFIFSRAGSRISLVKPIYKKIASVNGSSVVLVDLASVDGTTMKMEGESYLDGTTLNIDTSGEEILSYRCYIKKDDGTTETRNWWEIDDQAKCQTFNIEEGTHYNVENTYYWRRVVGVGSEKPDGSDEIYDFVDLSAADCDEGSDEPKEGDSIVHMGNRTNTSRQGFISIEVYSEDGSAPSFKVYKNVSDYSLVDKQRIVLSPKETSIVANKISIETSYDTQRVPMFRGDWENVDNHACYYYDVVMYDGATWLCTYPEKGINGVLSTQERPSETALYWKPYAQRGKNGASAAVAFCSPPMLIIPTDTKGVAIQDYDKELQFGISVDGVNLVVKKVEIVEEGWSSYIVRKGTLKASSSSASVSGSAITLKAQNVSGSSLNLRAQDGFSTDMETASISVKIASGTSIEDRSIQLKITGADADDNEYTSDCSIQITKQYVSKDGKDGKDGIAISLSTTSIIWEQDEDDEKIIKPSAYVIEVIANKGGDPITSGITVEAVDGYNYNHKEVVADSRTIVVPTDGIYTYNDGGIYKFYTNGYIDINVTYNGRTTAFQVNWYLNALGTFKTTIKGDVEESVAQKLTYGLGDGNVQTIEEVGRYIRSSSEAVTTLSKTVDGVVKSVTELEITAEGLTARVEDNEDNYSRISQRVDNIALKVGTSPNLFYNAFFDRNLTEVWGGTLPDTAVVLIEDNNALYGKNVLAFGRGNFTGNHRTGFMGADTKGYGVFLREGTYTFKVRARVTNSYTQGDAGITLAWDSAPNMGNYTSSKIIQKISVKSTEYNVFSYSFTLTTGRYVAFYLYFTDASVGGGGLQILVDAVSLKSGDTNEGFDVGNDSSSAGEAVDTMGEMLYDTGIDIEHKKITFTSDNFVYRNNKGEATALLDESGNMTIAGVYNNEVNDITDANANKYGVHTNHLFYLDPLKCPAVIRMNINGLSKIILPVAYNGNTPPKLTTYIEGSKAGNSVIPHSLEEMRQCIGKKIWLLRGENLMDKLIELQSGGGANSERPNLLMHVSDNMGDLANVAGSVNLVESAAIGHKISGTDYASRNFIFECKMGVYNGFECIYWEVRVSGIRLV